MNPAQTAGGRVGGRVTWKAERRDVYMGWRLRVRLICCVVLGDDCDEIPAGSVLATATWQQSSPHDGQLTRRIFGMGKADPDDNAHGAVGVVRNICEKRAPVRIRTVCQDAVFIGWGRVQLKTAEVGAVELNKCCIPSASNPSVIPGIADADRSEHDRPAQPAV